MIKKCIVCGKEFEPARGQMKMCSDECRAIKNRQNTARYKREHPEYVKKWNSKDERISKRKQIALLKDKKRAEAFEWLEKYNSSGVKGGNAMLAKEAGMSYEAWMAQPVLIRMKRREEILNVKRWERK